MAATTGSSYDDIASIFTKVAGQGRLMGDDLNRLAARGLNAASILGKALHKNESQIRQMVSKGKISFAEFSKAMDNSFGAHATAANETYSGSLANLHAAMSRLGAVFQSPHLESQRKLFNAMSPAIENSRRQLHLCLMNSQSLMKSEASFSGVLLRGYTSSLSPRLFELS